MPKNPIHSVKTKLSIFQKPDHQQLLKHIVRVFLNWYVGMYISLVRPLWLSALQFMLRINLLRVCECYVLPTLQRLRRTSMSSATASSTSGAEGNWT